MLFVQRLLGALLIAAIGGCSTVTVQSAYDRSVSFSGFKTYGWIPYPLKKTGDPRIDNNSTLALRIRNAVESQMAAKGVTKKSPGIPDFLVGYHVTLKKKTTTKELNAVYTVLDTSSFRTRLRYSPSSTQQTYAYEYEEGTLILDIIDPKTRKLLWRGSAKGEVDFSASREAKQERVNEAVERILEQFPPK